MQKNISEPCIPGHLDPIEGYALQCMTIDRKFKSCIEIGSLYGRSAYFICKGLSMLNQYTSSLLCIDKSMNWEGTDPCIADAQFPDNPPGPQRKEVIKWLHDSEIIDPNWYENYNNADNKIRMDLFNTTMNRFPFMHNYITMHIGTIDTVNLENKKFDFAFIDGDHRYEGVKNDFDKLYSHFNKHAVVAFHDYSHDSVKKYIHECIEKNILHKLKIIEDNLYFLQLT